MKVLITGATGFIGSQLLNDKPTDFDIKAVVRNLEFDFDDFETIYVPDINSKTCWKSALYGVDAVIHLAGLAHDKSFSESDYRDVNIDGTLNLASQAAETGVRRFVFVSTIGVNGSVTNGRPFSPDDVANPHNSYAKSKYEAELGLWTISKQTGLEVVVVRPTLVYGPNAPGNFGTLTKIVKKIPFLPFGLAKNSRDFISVRNLADLLIVCATHDKAAGNVFLAGESGSVSTKGFIDAISQGLGKKVIQVPVPVGLMKILGEITGRSTMIDQLFGDLQVDSSNLKELLGWTPPFTMTENMSRLDNPSE
ncbi:UDP-glucose 4-epimerase [Vibrio splendidus ZS-139]|nr:UDP-glucose 4-epimerase [Vibrio splendidus ZS-139]